MGRPLNLLHEDAVERIAEQVRRLVGGGRHFATCASLELRAQVEAELRARLGEDRVIRVDLPSGMDPWNAVRLFQLERGTPEEQTLYTLWGVHGDAPAGPDHPYAQLNLARDAWSSSGTHLLVWLDGLGEIPRLAEIAPDLWSARSLVEEFITLGDFAEVVEPTTPPEEDDRKVARLRHEATDPSRSDDARGWAELELAASVFRRGFQTEAEDILRRSTAGPKSSRAWGLLAVSLLLDSGRPGAATQELALQRGLGHADDDSGTRAAAFLAARQQGDPDRAIALLSGPGTPPHPELDAQRADTLAWCGRTSAAAALLHGEPTLAIAYRTGDVVLATSLAFQAGKGSAGSWVASRLAGVDGLATLGLAKEALCLMPHAPRKATRASLDIAFADALIRAEGRVDGERRAVGAWADLTRNATTPEASRALAARSLAGVADREEVLGRLAPHLLPLANQLHKLCKAEHDDEPLGVVDEVLARLHLALGDSKRAAHYARHLLEWAETWRGPSVTIRVHALLADIHHDLAHADTAVSIARPRLSLYDLSHALQARARVLVHHGRIDEARASLTEALDAVRPEGLRPEMIRLHLTVAQLPAGDDRINHAREALSLARMCRLIREEARALLIGLDLAPTPWGPRERAQFDRAARIVRELGPPWLDDHVARLRAHR